MSDTNPKNFNTKKKEPKKKRYLFAKIFLSVLTLSAIGVGGFVVGRVTYLQPDEKKLIDEYQLLKNEWLFAGDDLAADAAMGIAAYPASSKNDDYTFYTSTAEAQGLSTDGKGFGFVSHPYDGGLYVTEVCNGNSLGYLHVGDVLHGVTRGKEAYYDFSLHTGSEISAYLAEKKDTETDYVFTLTREGSNMQSEPIRRGNYSQILAAKITTPAGESDLPKGTAAIKVSSFLGNAASQLETQVRSALSSGEISHLILDLRGNGGGDVAQAELMADMFVRKGTLIYQMRDKNNKVLQSVYQRKDPTFRIGKFTILLDGRSASASEIFALAMRAGSNTEVYGLKSYGKGIAQRLITFADGSVLRYTYAKVFGPKRQAETMVIQDKKNDDKDVMCIHHQGITPDVSYPVNYLTFDNNINYAAGLGITESQQTYFLSMMKAIDDSYPDAYSASYHFDDAVAKFAFKQGISKAFDENGRVSKTVSDRFSKVTYDLFLSHQEKLLKHVWRLHDRF